MIANMIIFTVMVNIVAAVVINVREEKTLEQIMELHKKELAEKKYNELLCTNTYVVEDEVWERYEELDNTGKYMRKAPC